MSFVMIPGAGGASWYWHLVQRELTARGHEVVAVDLPVGGANGLPEYADAVASAAVGQQSITLVAQSMGAFTAAQVARRLPVAQIIFLNAMIPIPGETPGGWWEATGHGEAMRGNDIAEGRDPDAPFDMATYFLHDLSAELGAEIEQHGGADSEALFGSACDFVAWPNVPMHVMAGRDDRFFPVGFQRRVALGRLGLPVDEVDGGHLPALGHPQLIARLLEDYRSADLGRP
jgi:pimeloyl-ACP methyl ester carboxylesterase